MQFRWVALIALWTFLIGPVMSGSSRPIWFGPRTAAQSGRKDQTPPRKLRTRVQRPSSRSEDQTAANRWQLRKLNEKTPGESSSRLGQLSSFHFLPTTNR